MKSISKRLLATAACTATALVLVTGLDVRLQTTHYTVQSDAITAPLRIAILTDLHACQYGENQQQLLDAVYAEHPDLVLFGGDIFDEGMSIAPAQTVLSALGNAYPCYYVTGNHEYKFTLPENGATASDLIQLVRDCNVTVLDNTTATLTVQGQSLLLCGIHDPHAPAQNTHAALQYVAQSIQPDQYTVLLTHRPELIDDYLAYDFDLMVAGHAHGGQWRIPYLLDGLLAPNQGFFPQYAGGQYDFEGESGTQTLVVSRGLSRESTRIPRIYNRPELVVVTVQPTAMLSC